MCLGEDLERILSILSAREGLLRAIRIWRELTQAGCMGQPSGQISASR
jgi:hypothetical protein